MDAVVRQRLREDERINEGRSESEEVFIGFNGESFWDWEDFASDGRAECKAAGTKITTMQLEELGGRNRVDSKAPLGVGGNDPLGGVVEGINDSVANHAKRRIASHEMGNASEFPLGPPIIAIEKHDNLSSTFRNAHIERRGLTAVRLAENAHLG